MLTAGAAEGNHEGSGTPAADRRRRWSRRGREPQPGTVGRILLAEVVDDRSIWPGGSIRNCSWRPGLGRLRASNTNPPPFRRVGRRFTWKEKLKMWTVRGGVEVAGPGILGTRSMASKAWVESRKMVADGIFSKPAEVLECVLHGFGEMGLRSRSRESRMRPEPA